MTNEKTVEKLLLTPMEAAKEKLFVSKTTMYNVLLKDKTFPAFHIGKRIYINANKLQEWIDSQTR